MRAARLLAPGDVRVVDTVEPAPTPAEVLVQVRACGVCASDLNAWRGVPGIEYPLPMGAPGHEAWGKIVALGTPNDSCAHGLRLGQQVTGLMWNGLAELTVARAEDLVPIDEPLLGEPLACAMNVVRRAGPADLLAFVGFGYLAALCAQLLPQGTRWIALSRRDESCALALKLGAEAAHAFDSVPSALWDSVPVVIEAAGVQRTLELATWLTAYHGRLVVAGYHADGPRTVNMQSWNWKGIDVVNAHERRPEVLVAALRAGLRLVAERHLDLRPLHTHQFGLEDVASAFRAADERPVGFVKSLVSMRW